MNSQVPDAPTFRTSSLTPGMTWREAELAGLGAQKITFSVPSLVSFEYIIGIHSHPSLGDPNPTANRLPSANDWQAYASLRGLPTPSSLAPEYAFSQYIVGPDGKVRQYRQDAGLPSRATSGIVNGC